MSFQPLPTAFLERAARWAALSSCRLVDLGCGQGEVARWLEPLGLKVWGLDRYPLAAEMGAAIRADALCPPFQSGSLDGLLGANLAHHTLAQDPTGRFLARWLDLLNPDGCLFLLGDEPVDGGDPAVQNYHQWQAFLADIMPGQRGSLISARRVAGLLESAGARDIRQGVQPNHAPLAVDVVLEMLAGRGDVEPGSQADLLARRIRRHGLAPGPCWWIEARGLERNGTERRT